MWRMAEIFKVGSTENPSAAVIRIVHISDTHTRHAKIKGNIPEGDVLVHSGDFYSNSLTRHIFRESDFQREIEELNHFFSELPHKYKIFVAGNHDFNFDQQPQERIRSLLKNAIYLQDSGCKIHGIKFYGTPWSPKRSKSYARGFSRPWGALIPYWDGIPENTDVLITHIPPWNELRDNIVSRVKPKLHLHGHIHSNNNIWREDGVVFCNSAMDMIPQAHVIDYYTTGEESDTDLPVGEWSEPNQSQSTCVIS